MLISGSLLYSHFSVIGSQLFSKFLHILGLFFAFIYTATSTRSSRFRLSWSLLARLRCSLKYHIILILFASLCPQMLHNVISRYRVISVSPRFSSFACLLCGRLKVSYPLSVGSLFYTQRRQYKPISKYRVRLFLASPLWATWLKARAKIDVKSTSSIHRSLSSLYVFSLIRGGGGLTKLVIIKIVS